MEQDYTKMAKMIQAFSDSKRLLILDLLSCGERCATELQMALSLTQSTTSYHMKLLTDTGVVTIRSEGKYVFYSLNHHIFAWKISGMSNQAIANQLNRLAQDFME